MLPSLAAAALLLGLADTGAQPDSRLDRIQRRGVLGCGIEPDIPGFAQDDGTGRYRGLDADVCRAVAAAILGSADKVGFIRALSIAEFLRNDEIDIVARRITWELGREGQYGLLFGPITFHDGQSFLVSRALGITQPRQLQGRDVCVSAGTVFETNLDTYSAVNSLMVRKVPIGDPHVLGEIAEALASGRCRIYTSDVSLLGAIRSLLPQPAPFDILPDLISKEPLAPLVREGDVRFFTVVRWTIFALIAAEELGVTSKNVDEMRKSVNADVRRLLGVQPGIGKALGLSEDWAYRVIKTLGNYGELFEKNVGRDSPLALGRGLNRLWTDGGLMYAPPLR
jgi:general L-amino acid transport system substrate-binding protein